MKKIEIKFEDNLELLEQLISFYEDKKVKYKVDNNKWIDPTKGIYIDYDWAEEEKNIEKFLKKD